MAYRAPAASLFRLQNQLTGRQLLGSSPYEFCIQSLICKYSWSCDLKLSDFDIFSFEKKKDYENTIFIFENQQFNVLRRCFYELFPRAFQKKKVLTFKRWRHPRCLPPSGGAGKARFNVATPTYEARTRPLHVQHTYYRIIFKQNPFNIISSEVQGCTSTDFRLK